MHGNEPEYRELVSTRKIADGFGSLTSISDVILTDAGQAQFGLWTVI